MVLYRQGLHVTDVSFQHRGEIAVGSGGAGGEYYLRIPEQSRPDLLNALAEAAGAAVPDNASDETVREYIMALFLALFSREDEDPYVDIITFLRDNDVKYRGEYWPSR